MSSPDTSGTSAPRRSGLLLVAVLAAGLLLIVALRAYNHDDASDVAETTPVPTVESETCEEGDSGSYNVAEGAEC